MSLQKSQLPIILVDDGSSDATPSLLRQWRTSDAQTDRIVISHPFNRGKAAALHTAFESARASGYTHALSIDTDGQHDVADIPPLLQLAWQHRGALIVGVRSTKATGYPLASWLGRVVSNLLVRLESGAIVSDSQCGLRVYPLQPLEAVQTHAGRFGFETEVITRLAWAGVPMYETPIQCIYEVSGGRVSHFRPVRDSIAAVGTHARLMGRALLPWPAHKIARLTEAVATGTIAERLMRWLNPLPLWREIRRGGGGRRLAASMSVGIFMATLPLYGLKTVLCLCLSKWFGLQPLVVLAVSSLTTPPIGPLLAAISIVTGHVLLHGEAPEMYQYAPWRDGIWNTLHAVAADWIIGSIVFGGMLALLTYWIARWSVRTAPISNSGDR